MKFKPSEDRVVVKPLEQKNLSDGGIHLPNNALERPMDGKIMAVGALALGYSVGDLVKYGRYAGTEIPIEGEEYLIMRAGDIFGTVL